MDIIKRLRHRFIFLATAAVIIIVAGALGLINTIGYLSMRSNCMDVLIYISQHGGDVSRHERPQDTSWLTDAGQMNDTPEFSYQTRFFSVRTDKDGYVENINIKNISAFSEDEAVQYARTTAAQGQKEGFFEKSRANYGYVITPQEDGGHLIVIMDCTRDFRAAHAFLLYSFWFGVLCIVLYILIFAAMSKKAVAPFVHNMESQKRFITNAGHELKTPIAIISANTEAIELMNGKSQWTGSILKQVRRLSNLINDLIMLSKMDEHARDELQLVQLNAMTVVQSVVESFQSMMDDQSKTMTSELEADVCLRSDAKILYELVNILVDNAVKYCDDGGTVKVSLHSGKKHRGAVIMVANDYADGSEVDYERFFERFYRNDESHNSKKAGYGIGLSMAQELVKLLQGHLGVGYTEGKIIFTVHLG
jgi:signal transduction histidine kinase